jgi:ABC-type branched-subunit amino acid transport system ATPase component/ABC-type branched-subunit amino acid transport system permease subunit
VPSDNESIAGSVLDRLRPIVSVAGPAAAVVAVQLLLFPVPTEVWLQGLILGLLNAMVVTGLILVHRANRVVNLAQASIGLVPATLAGGLALFGTPSALWTLGMGAAAAVTVVIAGLVVARAPLPLTMAAGVVVGALAVGGLHVSPRFGWWGGLGAGVFTAAICGLGIDAIVITRFRRTPRLVVTVATIGLAQFFAVWALLIPRMWGKIALLDSSGDKTGFETPFGWTLTVGETIFRSAELLAVLVSIATIAAVTLFLRRSDLGIAVRAAADRSDRASMLGVPVPRIEAAVWVIASVLAFLATYLQAGILGLELTPGIGLRVMVAALGAMALGGFSSMPTMLLAAVAIGVLGQATGPAGGHSLTFTDAVLAAVVLVGLLVRRSSSQRSDRDSSSSWQSVAEPRTLPAELATLPSLRLLRWAGLAVLIAGAAAVPLVAAESNVLRASTLVALVLLAMSVVVLTGWTGEVTLGQMSFAATGAAVAAWGTVNHHLDFSLCLLLGGGAAALVAVLIALPSLRWQGIFLAVTTLAFALASINYLLNPTVAGWIPTVDVGRRPLFGIISLESRTAMYELALVVVVLCFVGVVGVRRSRVGRVLRAVRDNPAAAQSFGIRVPLARLSAFALSGFLAGTAGALIFYIDERYEAATFSAAQGLNVFISAVVGGVGSLTGAVLGALVLDGSRNFFTGPAALLPSAVGVLVILLVLPGGLAEVFFDLRDRVLRRWADRRGLHVPSLVADRRVPDPVIGFADDAEAVDAASIVHPAEPSTPAAAPAIAPPGEPGWLTVRGLQVAYDRVQVLFDVDLDLPKGQITALLGTNGAGKSTLLKAIGGVAPITAGTIHLDGVDLRSLRPEQVPQHGIVQMPGGHGVFPSLTVDENLRVAAWLFRRDRRDAATRIDDARGRFPVLEARRGDAAADLSGGQQQQLALAMALLARPDLLLIDELSLGLAPVVVADLLVELRRLRDEGTTIVIVEQSVNVALDIADHAYFMEKGEIRFSGAAADLLEQPDLVRSVYLQGASDALGGGPAAAPASTSPEVFPTIPATAGAPSLATAAPPALVTAGLSVSFGGVTAVDAVDLRVAAGEIVGLIGPNGAGKTTTFDLISGFTREDAGTVSLHGVDLTVLPPSSRARRGLGRSFQNAELFAGLTVAETIAVSLERWIDGDDVLTGAFRLPAARLAERQIAERVDELIDLFGLASFRSKRIGDLSTGSRRMVDLACVVAHRPSVILLDEPTSGIAQREAEALGPVMLGLRDRLDATLLVIEHDIALISSVADRLVALDSGRVLAEGPPAEVLAHPEVIASYLGSDDETLHRTGTRTEVAP